MRHGEAPRIPARKSLNSSRKPGEDGLSKQGSAVAALMTKKMQAARGEEWRVTGRMERETKLECRPPALLLARPSRARIEGRVSGKN